MSCTGHKVKYSLGIGQALYNEFQREAKKTYAEVNSKGSFYAVETSTQPNYEGVTQLSAAQVTGDRLGLESALSKVSEYQQVATSVQSYVQPAAQSFAPINPANKGLEYMAKSEDEGREERLRNALGERMQKEAYQEMHHSVPKILYEPGEQRTEFRKLDIDIRRPEPASVHQLFYTKEKKQPVQTYAIANDYSKTARMKKELQKAKEETKQRGIEKKVLLLTHPEPKEEKRLAA